MWKCPVCDKENTIPVCEDCGFDMSTDYESLPTLSAVNKVQTVSNRRKQMKLERERHSVSADYPRKNEHYRIGYSDGSRYYGELKDGLRNGHGVMTYANGDVYDGQWKDGKPVCIECGVDSNTVLEHNPIQIPTSNTSACSFEQGQRFNTTKELRAAMQETASGEEADSNTASEVQRYDINDSSESEKNAEEHHLNEADPQIRKADASTVYETDKELNKTVAEEAPLNGANPPEQSKKRPLWGVSQILCKVRKMA